MTFDRLLYIDRLRQAGIDEPLARAHADALRQALLETVATKADVELVRADLATGLGQIRAEMNTELAQVRAEMAQLRTDLTHKIEISARDLTIRGAGALVIIVSVIIGLKLFG